VIFYFAQLLLLIERFFFLTCNAFYLDYLKRHFNMLGLKCVNVPHGARVGQRWRKQENC